MPHPENGCDSVRSKSVHCIAFVMAVSARVASDTRQGVEILCIDISTCSSSVQFCMCSLAVFLFYLLYGYMQELIFTLEGFEHLGWFLTLMQFGYYTVFGVTERHFRKMGQRRYACISYNCYICMFQGRRPLYTKLN